MVHGELQGAAANGVHVTRRLSWGAVIAGAVMIVVMQILLGLLGLSVAARSINPATEQSPMAGIGTGAGIWFLVTTVISLFAGGWIAGRLGASRRSLDSALHGLVAWGTATMLTFLLLTSAIGSVVGGAFGVLGKGAELLGRGAVAAAPAAGQIVQNQLQQAGGPDAIRREAERLLSDSGKPELQPGNLLGPSGGAKQGQDDIASLLTRLLSRGDEAARAADRDALVNVVATRGRMSREEASALVSRWEQTYASARSKIEETKQSAERTARDVGQATTQAVSMAAIWSFFALLLGGAAAALGGLFGTPRDDEDLGPGPGVPSERHAHGEPAHGRA